MLELEPDLTYYFGLYLVDDLDGNVRMQPSFSSLFFFSGALPGRRSLRPHFLGSTFHVPPPLCLFIAPPQSTLTHISFSSPPPLPQVIIRKLQDFESPFISLMRAEPHQKVQLRKAYWNINFDKLLWDNAVALNLLYIETIAELKNGHIKPSEEAADQLAEFRSNRDRKSFLELAREQEGYGFAKFGECTVNHPEVGEDGTRGKGDCPSGGRAKEARGGGRRASCLLRVNPSSDLPRPLTHGTDSPPFPRNQENASVFVSLGNPGNTEAAIVFTEKVGHRLAAFSCRPPPLAFPQRLLTRRPPPPDWRSVQIFGPAHALLAHLHGGRRRGDGV